MHAAQKIRQAVARVAALREAEQNEPRLREAVGLIKRIQARRFSGTYSDLLRVGPYAAAARFFLDELYSDRDYSERDAQFARIAGAIERLFPSDVAQAAAGLAELHAMTEELDQAMALAWLEMAHVGDDVPRYAAAWRHVGRRTERERQLAVVLEIGQEMIRLTRTRGLRVMLKMMRGPAAAAGLSSLQRFLEAGFDTFGTLARTGAAQDFLRIVSQRKADLITLLFDAEPVACETELARILGQAP
jgi:hypothetical protein